MRRLLFVVNVDWFFVSHRLPIAIEAMKHGYDVHLACNITDKREFLENLGITLHELPLSRSGMNVFSECRSIFILYKIIRKLDFDIIHSITIKPVIYANIVARFFSNAQRVSSISGLGYIFIAKGVIGATMRSIIEILYRFALSGSNKVIFQNSSDRDLLIEIKAIEKDQAILIRGSGVNLDDYTFLPESTESINVVLVARLLIDKGVNEFVQAAALLKKNSNINMVLVGEIDYGNPKSITSEQLNQWCDSELIDYWGYSNNIAETMTKANIVVLPSYREGLPKCLIEAAACGRAVITTDVPGCRDAIEENRTGLLVPAKEVEPLAAAILDLATDNMKRKRFGTNGRALAERVFSIADVVSKHLDIYERC